MNTDVNFYLKKLDNHVQRYIHTLDDMEEFRDCSRTNMWVTDFLYQNRDREIFQKDIEEEFFINRATASKMLSLMEKKKLIRRVPLPQDGRYKRLELLERGLELQKVCAYVRAAVEFKVTSGLSSEETELFKALCRRMIESMEI